MQEPMIVCDPLPKEAWERIAREGFGDMVKVEVDQERGVIAIGGEMHAQGEQLLLCGGSRQEDLWGINVYADRPYDDRIEYVSLINIRPRQNNRSMEVEDESVRKNIRTIIDRLLL